MFKIHGESEKKIETFLKLEYDGNGNIVLRAMGPDDDKFTWTVLDVINKTGKIRLRAGLPEGLGLKLDYDCKVILED